MPDTSSTTRKPSGVLVHAMRAVAAHIFDNDLPVPMTIDFDDLLDEVTIHVSRDAAEAWVASLAIDQVEEKPYTTSARRAVVHVHRHGRLPDTGVRVDLLTIHRAGLAVVPA